MKIPEKELRKIIRAQILSERFDVELIPVMNIEQCELEIPPEYSLNQLSLAANDAMALYGIPGSFCDIVNSLIPKPKKKRTSSGGDDNSGSGEESQQSFNLLESVRNDIADARTLFLPDVNTSNPSENEVLGALDYYKQKIDYLNQQELTQPSPQSVARGIVTNVFRDNGSVSDINSKISQVSSRGDLAIRRALVGEAKLIMKTQAMLELNELEKVARTSEAKNAISLYKTEVERS